jgi:microcystin-dependent protein
MKRIDGGFFLGVTILIMTCAFNANGQTLEERVNTLEQNIRELRASVEALTGVNARLKEEFEGKQREMERSLTESARQFQSSLNAELGVVTAAQNQLKSAFTTAQDRVNGLISVNPPVGTVIAFAGPVEQIPENWKLCNGDTISESTYPALWRAIGTTWGGSDPGAFKLPDLRGLFLRGLNAGSDRDPDERTLGSIQGDGFKAHDHPATSTSTSTVSPNPHTHGYREPAGRGGSEAPGRQGLEGRETSPTGLSVSTSTTTTVGPRGGAETRPANAAVYWIIKVKNTTKVD